MQRMSETQTDPQLNGQAPAAAEAAPCTDCASTGERLLAVIAAALGLAVVFVAIDMFTGGKLTGVVREQVAAVQAAGD
jgi:hypothetical protein